MTSLVFVDEMTATAIHDMQIAEHGGLSGVRDHGLLGSALARPQNLAAYGETNIAALAAALAHGIARNHPFLDGNKRTAFVCSMLFLRLNGWRAKVDHLDATMTFLKLAAGEITEAALAEWFQKSLTPTQHP